MLSIIIPVRNETDILKDIINYFSQNLREIKHEILIINDFSEDDTLEKAKSLTNGLNNFRVLNNLKKV